MEKISKDEIRAELKQMKDRAAPPLLKADTKQTLSNTIWEKEEEQ
jgi:hypothetical protein